MSRREVTSAPARGKRFLETGNGSGNGNGNGSHVVDLTDPVVRGDAVITPETPIIGTRGRAAMHHRLLAVVLMAIDVLCLVAALLTAHALRFGILPGREYLQGSVFAAVVWVAVFAALGLYRSHHLSGHEELRRTVSAVGIGIVLGVMLGFWFDVYLSRSWVALTLLLALILELGARGIVRLYVKRLQARRSMVMHTLVVGSADEALHLIDTLEQPGSGFRALGYVDAESPFLASEELTAADRVARFRSVLSELHPDCVFLASLATPSPVAVAVMQAARQEGVIVRIYTHLSGILASRLTVQPVGNDGVALTLRPARLSMIQRAVKRAMDLVVAGIGLLLTSPVLLAAAMAIKITSRGPVMFRQERVTEGGRVFRMFKFRTMRDVPNGHVPPDPVDTSVPFFKLKTDPRLTTVGRWLRRWSIDELPQLLNVLLGDMSLVGPRPLPADQVSANLELLGPRHEVRAGLTGWWQTQGRSEVGPHEAIRMDQFYIENWSPSLDAYILLKTIGVVFSRRGAF